MGLGPKYIQRTQQDKNGNDYIVYEAQYTSTAPAKGVRWYVCHLCGEFFSANDVVLKGEVAFCIPNKDYLDMNERRSGGKL